MEEQSRIGLTNINNQRLDEMLESLNDESGQQKLIKFDLIRLAVAWAINKGIEPVPPTEATDNAHRVSELDLNQLMSIAITAKYGESADLANSSIIENLANYGIEHFYRSYSGRKMLPWDKLLSEIE